MPFCHLPCHSAICHVIPPSAMSFRHPLPHSTIRHPIPPSTTPFRHPPPHSSHRPLGPILILSRWQAQHNTFDQPPHLILPSVTSLQCQFLHCVKIASSTYCF